MVKEKEEIILTGTIKEDVEILMTSIYRLFKELDESYIVRAVMGSLNASKVSRRVLRKIKSRCTDLQRVLLENSKTIKSETKKEKMEEEKKP